MEFSICKGCGWSSGWLVPHAYYRCRQGKCAVLDRFWTWRFCDDSDGVFSIWRKQIGGETWEYVGRV